MEWHRVKTILIALFSIINIGLLLNITYTDYALKNISDKTLEDIVHVMEERGVLIDKKIIPAKKIEMKKFVLGTSVEKESALAAGIFKFEESFVDAEGALVFEGGKNNLRLFDGINIDFLGEYITEGFSMDEQSAIKIAKQFAEKMNPDGILLEMLDVIESPDGYEVIYSQTRDGVRIETSRLVIEILQNGIFKAGGNFIYADIDAGTSLGLNDPLSALVNSLSYLQDTQIQSIDFGYVHMKQSSSYLLMPVWIVADKDMTIYFDVETGERLILND